MKLSYDKIGNHIRPLKVRNDKLQIVNLLGINIDKFFMPSVANTVGTNLRNYKIVRKNQFACNRMHVGRDYRIPIALSNSDNPFIVSPAYDVFEIIDTSVLLPEYLMMWFSRKEFDRNAWFYTDADVRGGLPWNSFCNIELPVPSIEKQQEIIDEFKTVENRIELNKKYFQKLDETTQTLYKHWFEDFEFPDENGNPYKSSGGEMEWNNELGMEIPRQFKAGTIEDVAGIIDGDRGRNYPNQSDFFDNEYCLFLNTGNVTKNGFDFSKNSFITKIKDEQLRKGKLQRNDIVLTTRGTVGNCAYYSETIPVENIRINSGMVILRSHEEWNSLFLFYLMRSDIFKTLISSFSSGSAQPQLPIKDIRKIKILIPSDCLIQEIQKSGSIIQRLVDLLMNEREYLETLLEIIMSRMAINDSVEISV